MTIQSGSEAAGAASVAEALRVNLAPGGRDRRLLDRQVLLTGPSRAALYDGPVAVPSYPAGSLAGLEAAARRLANGARPGLATAAALTRALARLSVRDGDRGDRSATDILASREATVLERARTLALLAWITGTPARVCLLYRDTQPDFHAVAEVIVMDSWAVFDPLAGQFYLVTHHPYASAWDIKRRPAIADGHPDHGRKPTVDSSFYRSVCIAPIEYTD